MSALITLSLRRKKLKLKELRWQNIALGMTKKVVLTKIFSCSPILSVET